MKHFHFLTEKDKNWEKFHSHVLKTCFLNFTQTPGIIENTQ